MPELPAASLADAVAWAPSLWSLRTRRWFLRDRWIFTLAVWPPPMLNAPAPSLLPCAPRSSEARDRRPAHERSLAGQTIRIERNPLRLIFTEPGAMPTRGAVVSAGGAVRT